MCTTIVLFLSSITVVAANYDHFEFTCPKENGVFADPMQCDKYYECTHAEAVVKLCPDGLVFDPNSKLTNKCDQPFNINCRNRKNRQKPKPSGACPRQNGYFPHPDPAVCNIFYNCVNGRELEMTCVAGLHFSLKTGTCTWPDLAGRSDCSGSVNKKLDDGFHCPLNYKKIDKNGQIITHPTYPHPEDCSKFYICLNGVEPKQGTCDAGLVYNENIVRCDEPENVPSCEAWPINTDELDR